jgi:hypothetical protein
MTPQHFEKKGNSSIETNRTIYDIVYQVITISQKNIKGGTDVFDKAKEVP